MTWWKAGIRNFSVKVLTLPGILFFKLIDIIAADQCDCICWYLLFRFFAVGFKIFETAWIQFNLLQNTKISDRVYFITDFPLFLNDIFRSSKFIKFGGISLKYDKRLEAVNENIIIYKFNKASIA